MGKPYGGPACHWRIPRTTSDNPILALVVTERIEVRIGRENDKPVLPCQSAQHDVNLRERSSTASEFKEGGAVKPRGILVQRPKSQLPQQLLQSATVISRGGDLLNARLQLAQHRHASDEPMTCLARLLNAVPNGGDLSNRSREMIAVQQIVGHHDNPIVLRTCSLAMRRDSSSAFANLASSGGSPALQRAASSAKSRSISSAETSASSTFSTRNSCPSRQSGGKGSIGRITPPFKTALGI